MSRGPHKRYEHDPGISVPKTKLFTEESGRLEKWNKSC